MINSDRLRDIGGFVSEGPDLAL